MVTADPDSTPVWDPFLLGLVYIFEQLQRGVGTVVFNYPPP